MRETWSRRRFLSKAALGGATLLALKDARSARGAPANSSLGVALIGVGGRGTWFVDTIPRMERVVAVCDVNDEKVDEANKRWADLADRFAVSPHDWERSAAPAFRRLADEKVKAFRDFRRMLDEMGKAIDAVVIAIPDHTHAVASAAAIRAGKHVFCEKPLTRTVGESRALLDLARSTKVATSMGNQGTASGPFRRALELIRDGTIGEIREVHVWNSGGGADRKEPPKGGEAVPPGFAWDLWLGPAALRPYHRQWIQRHLWREFGTNQLGNWASHSANLAFMALKVDSLWRADPAAKTAPKVRIEARSSGINRLSFPRWEIVHWDIPARAEFPAIRFTWHNGQAPGSRDLLEGLVEDDLDWGDKKEKRHFDHAGAVIVGAKGRIHATGHNATFRLLPASSFEGIEKDRPISVDHSRGHEMDWFIACRGGKPAWAAFEYAAPLNEFLMLGNVATQFEGPIEYDPIACAIAGRPEADAQLRFAYWEGWKL
ncbi:MAG: Gfo/Idh/MocA family oxidoreductase [Planctomycetes bacterium]|nr:Gfo/Idh/MocA family oxidoreductase [Planctomycetota bacterium]